MLVKTRVWACVRTRVREREKEKETSIGYDQLGLEYTSIEIHHHRSRAQHHEMRIDTFTTDTNQQGVTPNAWSPLGTYRYVS